MKKTKQFLTLCGLTAVAMTVIAAPIDNLQVNKIDKDLLNYVKNKDSGWFGYSIPAPADTASMCCFKNDQQSYCDLNKKQHGFGSTSKSSLTENIHVLVHMNEGQVSRMIPVGDHCDVRGDDVVVDWLENVGESQSIQWLTSQAVNDRNDGSSELYVLSLHATSEAAMALHDLAVKNDENYSEQSVFWLSQRKQDGFKYLKSLYDELPYGQVRRHLNFAVSQVNTEEAVKLLKQVAQSDKDQEQQGDAIFWLSQIEAVMNLPEFLNTMLEQADNDEIKEKAIFSLSQINNEEANQKLSELANDHQDSHVREQALFWLSQNNPEQAKAAAIKLIKASNNENELENAIFVLSQLPGKQASSILFEVINGDYDKKVKRKALFWLSQSDDKEVINKLAEML